MATSLTDNDISRSRDLLGQCRDGYSLPQEFYSDQMIHRLDMAAIFQKEWIFVGPECELPQPGDYVTLQIDVAPVIVLRAPDNTLRAYHNTCRHRGSRLCRESRGHAANLVCPYHQWTYDLEGSLIATRYMPADLEREDFPLGRVHVVSIEGLIYVCLAETPPDIEKFRAEITPYIAPHEPRKTKIVHESVIVENANWKLVIENNRECYHCAGAHPELLVSLVEMALPNDTRFAEEYEIMRAKAAEWDKLGLPHKPMDGGVEYRGIRLPFRKGAISMTLDGKLGCKKLLGNLVEPDLGSVRAFRIPNNWHHFLSDHILHFRVLPLGPDKTEVRTVWMVHEDALEGWDYDPVRLSEVWTATNAQDQMLAEENHRGIKSPGYRPGPYSQEAEFMILHFMNWYRGRLANHLGGGTDAGKTVAG